MHEPSLGADLDEVFGVVANETRIAILRALWDEHTANPEEVDGPRSEPVAFSTLRERVGVADSGQFNYHLDKLVPEFVQHREGGYVLTHAGAQVVGAAVSGVYTDTDADLEAAEMGACTVSDCTGTLEASYEDGHVTVACDTCDLRTVMHVPPVVVGTQDVGANPDLLQQFTLTEMQRLVRGFCNLCDGPVEASVGTDSPSEGPVAVVHVCQACGSISHTSAAVFVLDHPAVVSLLHDAGIDYRSIALWQTPPELAYEETVRSLDPLRLEVTVTVDSKTLDIVLDDDFDVVEARRGPGTADGG
jgi:DNA-binding transcriptional ArsR family regulator